MSFISLPRRNRAKTLLLCPIALAMAAASVPFVTAAAPSVHSIGSIQYVVTQVQPGVLDVGTAYPHQTGAELQSYVVQNRSMLQQLLSSDPGGNISVTVVLSHPLPLSNLSGFVARHALKVDRYIMRAVSSSGRRITISGAPLGKELVPALQLRDTLQSLEVHDPGARLLGVVTVDGSLTATAATALAQDPQTYLVDVSREAVRRRVLAEEGLGPAAKATVSNVLPLYWFLENAGLVTD